MASWPAVYPNPHERRLPAPIPVFESEPPNRGLAIVGASLLGALMVP